MVAMPGAPLLAVLLAGLVAMSPLLPTTLGRNILVSPDALYAGQQLDYGYYRFVMQADCNVVLYDGGSAVWSTKTYNVGSNCRLKMQSDGNLVLYDGNNRARWSSGTYGSSGTFRCILQADRNVVVYGPESGGAYGPARWSTKTYVGKAIINLEGNSVTAASNTTLA